MLSVLNAESNSNYYLFRWAQWLRIDYHMEICSNHSEGAHGNIKESIEL